MDIDRHSAWIFTCESWMAQGAYIVAPINPEQLSFQLNTRSSTSVARAVQVVHVWRNLGTGSTSALPTISISLPSGYLVPSFDPEVIVKTMDAVGNNNAMSFSQLWGGALDGKPVEAARSQYEDLSGVTSKIPAWDQAKDLIGSGVYKSVGLELEPNHLITDSYASKSRNNLPDLYSRDNAKVPIGIQNLYAMYNLVDERRIRHTLDSGQIENRAMIVLSTPVFPRLTLWGWFGAAGLKHSDTVDNYGSVDIEFEFIVTDSSPSLGFNAWADLEKEYVTGWTGQESTLEHARNQWPSHTKAQSPKNKQGGTSNAQ